jgi:DNA primase
MNGPKVPSTIAKLARERITTLFVDGDRVGNMIAKEVVKTVSIDYIAQAPSGKEVEELNKREILRCLKERISAEEYKRQV